MSTRKSRRSASGVKLEAYSDNEGPIIPAAETSEQKETRRLATLYDAVAGRVKTTESLKRSQNRRNHAQDSERDAAHFSRRDARLAPEEVLFRRKKAPERFAEKDIYFANEGLPDDGRGDLPDSDLLKSVHAYASRFYEALGRRRGLDSFVGSRLVDERSMDETALLAMGVLLEEAARETLGKSDDLVFTEGVDDSRAGQGGAGKEEEAPEEITVGYKSEDDFWRRRYPKRLKVAPPEDDDEEALRSLSSGQSR